jgi:ADP-ribose pyrophosphatase YjhB (NUDIX family)
MMRQSALSWVRRGKNDLLVVYNERFGGYGLPGGMYEPEKDMDVEDTQRRELLEETGLKTKKATHVYRAMHSVSALQFERSKDAAGRARGRRGAQKPDPGHVRDPGGRRLSRKRG